MRAIDDRLVRLVLIAGAVASLLPQVALAFYAFPSADDYCVALPPRDGFWQAQVFWYTQFTGRFSEMLVESAVTRWDLARMYPWFILATFAGTVLAVRAIVGALQGAGAQARETNVVALVAVAVFAGGLPSTVEAFYWMTGAVAYQWALVVFAFWTALLVTLVNRPLPAAARLRRRTALVVLTVLVPGFNEVMAPLVFAVLLGAIGYNRRRALESPGFLLILAVIVVGLTAVSFLSPGNSLRGQSYPDLPTRYNLTFALPETARQTVRFITQYSAYPALWLAGIAGWWWAWRAPSHPRTTGIGLGLLLSLMYLSLLPLYWVYGSVNYTGEGRTYNITYVTLFVGILMAVGLVLGEWARHSPGLVQRLSLRRNRVDLVLACSLAALLVAAPSTRRAVRALATAPEFAERQREREAVLRTAPSDATVVVDAIATKPEGLFWGDIQPDEEHWINQCVAGYYRLKGVRTP